MSIYDVSHYGIRVILDDGYYDVPMHDQPFQVEGTVLQLMIHSKEGQKLYENGRLIDLLCNYTYEGAADAYVRWDHDVKVWVIGGTMFLRGARIGRIKSIWEEDNIAVDNTPFHLFRPRTKRVKPASLWGKQVSETYQKMTRSSGKIDPESPPVVRHNQNGTITYIDTTGAEITMNPSYENVPGAEKFVVHFPNDLPPVSPELKKKVLNNISQHKTVIPKNYEINLQEANGNILY